MSGSLWDYEYKQQVHFKIAHKGRDSAWSYCFIGENPKYFKDFHTLVNHLQTVYWMFFPKGGMVIADMKRANKRCNAYKLWFREVYIFDSTFKQKEYMPRNDKYKRNEMEMTDARNFIKMNDKFMQMIKDGTKTKTTRLGKRDYALDSARFSSDESSLFASIIGITYKKLANVTEEEAKADGFNSVQELVAELLNYYPDLIMTDEVTIVEFKYIKEAND